MEKFILLVSAFVITFQALANLIRFLWDIPVMIGEVYLPGWTGALLFILLGLLAALMFRAIYVVCSKRPYVKQEPPPPGS